MKELDSPEVSINFIGGQGTNIPQHSTVRNHYTSNLISHVVY
jgi:hypothetical protein